MKDIIYTRKYIDRNGEEKKEYITVGYMFEKDGRTSILLKNYINPAALANEKGEVWLNVYEHKQKEEKPQQAPKMADKTSLYGNVEPTVAEVTKVVNEGKEYAQKWAEMNKQNEVTDDVPF